MDSPDDSLGREPDSLADLARDGRTAQFLPM
jgi:hypothetical protein